MRIDELIDVRNIDTDITPMSKEDAIARMVALLAQNGFVSDADVYEKAIYHRESEISTAVGYGVAIPHAKTAAVKKATIAILRNLGGIQWGDERVNLVFMIAASDADSDEHLRMLSKISTFLMDEVFRAKLLTAPDAKTIYDELLKEDAAKDQAGDSTKAQSENGKYLVGISACMTGIAHTYMAAEALTNEAKSRGMRVKIQTNGSTGVENRLTPTDIEQADAIIVAHDVKVDTSVFGDRPYLDVAVKKRRLTSRRLYLTGLWLRVVR